MLIIFPLLRHVYNAPRFNPTTNIRSSYTNMLTIVGFRNSSGQSETFVFRFRGSMSIGHNGIRSLDCGTWSILDCTRGSSTRRGPIVCRARRPVFHRWCSVLKLPRADRRGRSRSSSPERLTCIRWSDFRTYLMTLKQNGITNIVTIHFIYRSIVLLSAYLGFHKGVKFSLASIFFCRHTDLHGPNSPKTTSRPMWQPQSLAYGLYKGGPTRFPFSPHMVKTTFFLPQGMAQPPPPLYTPLALLYV